MTDESRYRAMVARDPRFDGVFFVGVRTTSIYCRPICPARPKRANVEFFPDRLAAERAGYRPCLRCRPEAAPASAAWEGRGAVVRRALRLLAEAPEAGREGGGFAEADLAARVGVSVRHLRRLVREETGRTPKQLADLARLDLARKLVLETTLPMTEVGLAAGFGSLRRFNDAFRRRFRRAPSQLRRGRRPAAEHEGAAWELRLAARPPFDWESLLRWQRMHAISTLEAVGETAYERVFERDGRLGHVRVEPDPRARGAGLRVWITAGDPRAVLPVLRNLRRMFDLDADPRAVGEALAQEPRLRRLSRASPGLRVARGWDPFETAVATVLGQFVSTDHARGLVAQLLEEHGRPGRHPLTGEPVRLFPDAATLADAPMRAVRTTSARKQAIRELARAVRDGRLRFDVAQDPAAFRATLRGIRGVGPWTAEYVSLRALGDPDAFPAADLILKRVLERYPRLDPERVRPWRAYAAVLLWKHFARRPQGKRRK
jgi:AraC family transcriptional regulator of adaptative response / DNA-3-methyladenine glycosylase II